MVQEKLSIYPSANPAVVLVENPSPIEPHVKVVRETVSDILGDAKAQVDIGVDHWVRFERRVEREVKSVLPKDEPLTPGILYIGVAGLAGSVLARNRNILLRLTLPPAFFLASAPYFLPKTSHNVRQYLSKVEDTRFPDLAAQHNTINRQVSTYLSTAKDRAEHLGDDVSRLGGKITRSVEDTTGLKLGDALGQARKVKGDVMAEVERRRGVEQAQVAQAVQGKGEARVIGVVTEEIPVAEIIATEGGDVKTTPIVGAKPEKRLV